MVSKKNTLIFFIFVLLILILVIKTKKDILPLPQSLNVYLYNLNKVQILDRNYIPLTVTYQNRWNIHDFIPIHAIHPYLKEIFIFSEDRRFYKHNGVDWKARFHAVFQNIKALRSIRGASTISEQVVRMWHPRPRTLWSRWLEGIEAFELEKFFSKSEIFEFYLNQAPYASCRRGIVQASYYFFDRDLTTLNLKEMLALVIMVRSPVRYNIHKNINIISNSINILARQLFEKKIINKIQYDEIKKEKINVQNAKPPVDAQHFVQYIYSTRQPYLNKNGKILTTLDSSLQSKIQTIIDYRLKDLEKRKVYNGAAIVLDHVKNEVLSWVNGNALQDDSPTKWIDAINVARQPGSTLKPFLYALALEKGWNAATIIEDSPISEPVGIGLHTYKNYSHIYYGKLRLREALANSLNIPAIRTIKFVGVSNFLNTLKELGIKSLKQHPDYYGDGLALGNGELTLLELVQAYAVLARQGIYKPFKLFINENLSNSSNRVFSEESSSLIGNILSDPDARHLEFGQGSILRFPVQTAVKTGTSSDYRDAWAIGYNDRYTAGVWMGNLNTGVMDGITGAIGPALILRAIFAELNRSAETHPLFLSPKLEKLEICKDTGTIADDFCPKINEWFMQSSLPLSKNRSNEIINNSISLLTPTQNLKIAMDPRIQDEKEAFLFEIDQMPKNALSIDWFLDNVKIAVTKNKYYLWSLKPGTHTVYAQAILESQIINTQSIKFFVQ